MRLRRLMIGGIVAAATVLGTAAPALAPDCFNANQRDGPRVQYSISFAPGQPPTFTQLGNAKGIGGFITVDGVDVHTIGNSESKDLVGGPGSQKPEHACDEKGIDYIEACAP